FNGLMAPVLFPKLWEFPLAIFAAGLVRPKMFDVGLLDNWIASMFEGQADQSPQAKPGHKGQHKPMAVARSVTANESLVGTLDYLWPIGILVITAVMAFALAGVMNSLG